MNDPLSNTGMNLFRATIAPLANGRRFFTEVVETGSHRGSMLAIAEGAADVAAIDAVTFAHLDRDEPALAAAVRTIAWTAAAPGLPFVTSADTSDDVVRTLRKVLREMLRDEAARSAIDMLMIAGIPGPPSYGPILAIEREAERRGYAELA